MSSQDFPTYGRDEQEAGAGAEHPPAVPPAQPYGQGQYTTPPQPRYGEPPAYPQQYPQQQHNPYQQPSQFGQYGPPPQQPVVPPWQQVQPQQQPRQPGEPAQRGVEPNPQVARLAVIGGAVAAFYGLLVLTLQRTEFREIAQSPLSDLNHPLRTDIIDTIGQLAVAALTGAVLVLWIRDLLDRRKRGQSPVFAELIAFAFMGVALIFVAIWFFIIASTGFGSIDDTTDRLPTAYGYGGVGLWLLAAGLFLVYRTLRPDVTQVIQSAPNRPPWEQ